MDVDVLCFNAATLIAGVFVLDYGADKFIDHTVIVGQRLGVSQTVIALLTAGAEWEELAVVVAAVLQRRSPLALGNVMGSAISNILGAFSLGLLFYPQGLEFDRSAKIYSTLLLAVTTLFTVLAFFSLLNRLVGGILIAIFGLYLVSIIYAIYKGVASPPELSDSDSDGEASDGDDQRPLSETAPLIENENHEHEHALSPIDKGGRRSRGLAYHIFHLVLGFVSLSLSGYILSHSAVTIADSLHISGTVFGMTVVSFATTLPEKLVAVLSGSRGQAGIMAATTAGSNIFLLTLCLGVVAAAGHQPQGVDSFVLFELLAVWVSSLAFCAVVFLGLVNRILKRDGGLLLTDLAAIHDELEPYTQQHSAIKGTVYDLIPKQTSVVSDLTGYSPAIVRIAESRQGARVHYRSAAEQQHNLSRRPRCSSQERGDDGHSGLSLMESHTRSQDGRGLLCRDGTGLRVCLLRQHIVITALGVTPSLASCAGSTAYSFAPARITKRRICYSFPEARSPE
ncbi:Sodium calcium transporter [Trichophyton interdigitale]|nr:Sodium/calcium transporter [Trichophyton interdigitale]KAG5218215.1 Sodium/calcium transporter [Trichophyton interdigitale]KAG8206627.1 Sodium calcium transporter [Trichophyton interdigitale]